MIILNVADYCHNCPEFEAHVEKDILEYEDFTGDKAHLVGIKTNISCEHRDRCEEIRKFIEKEKMKNLL